MTRAAYYWCSPDLILNVQGAEIEVSQRLHDGPYPAAVRVNVRHGDDFVDLELTDDEAADLAIALEEAAARVQEENEETFRR